MLWGILGFAESSFTYAEPSQLLGSFSIFYISTLAIKTEEYSALSIVDQQGRAAHKYKSKACLVSSHEPEETEANTDCFLLVYKTDFCGRTWRQKWALLFRPWLDYAVEYFPCVFKFYIKCTVYTFIWLCIASCLQFCAILQLFIS